MPVSYLRRDSLQPLTNETLSRTIIFHFLPLVGSAGPTVEMGSRTISSNRHGDMRYAETDAFDFIERNAGELCALCDATSCVTHFRLFPPHDFALQPWGGVRDIACALSPVRDCLCMQIGGQHLAAGVPSHLCDARQGSGTSTGALRRAKLHSLLSCPCMPPSYNRYAYENRTNRISSAKWEL